MNMFMVFLLTFILQDTYVLLYAFVFTECEDLPKLTYCQPFNTSRWRLRAECKNCPDGKKYHCCKDYDATKLSCKPGTSDCEEIFVEGCAVEKFCKEGEEPLLSFVKNQQKLDQPDVYCDVCHNSNRYNIYANKSSATFSECPFVKRNICTPESHKIECGKSGETRERFCRCDVRNGYHPYSHPEDHPQDGCSFTNYECKNDTNKCVGQQLLLNYTCAALCKKGFSRPESSDDCVATPTTTLSQKKESTLVDASTISQGPVSTTVPQSNKKNNTGRTGVLELIGVIIAGIVIIVAIIVILYCFRKKIAECLKICRRADREPVFESIEMIVPEPVEEPTKTPQDTVDKTVVDGKTPNRKHVERQLSALLSEHEDVSTPNLSSNARKSPPPQPPPAPVNIYKTTNIYHSTVFQSKGGYTQIAVGEDSPRSKNKNVKVYYNKDDVKEGVAEPLVGGYDSDEEIGEEDPHKKNKSPRKHDLERACITYGIGSGEVRMKSQQICDDYMSKKLYRAKRISQYKEMLQNYRIDEKHLMTEFDHILQYAEEHNLNEYIFSTCHKLIDCGERDKCKLFNFILRMNNSRMLTTDMLLSWKNISSVDNIMIGLGEHRSASGVIEMKCFTSRRALYDVMRQLLSDSDVSFVICSPVSMNEYQKLISRCVKL